MPVSRYPLILCTLSLSVLCVFLPSCKSGKTGGTDQGVIEYKLEVIENNNPIMSTDMLPGTMTTRFKDNNMSQELSAGMGMFSTSFISDFNHKTIAQTLSMLGKQYACKVDSSGLPELISKEPKLTFQFVEGSKIIAGYNCKKALVRPENGTAYEIYYTDEISIENPNFYNAYAPVKGVLMDFQVTRYNIRMHLTASKVTSESVSDELFTLNAQAKMVSIDEMNSYFNGGN
ncbi:MAG: hypothetical protein ACK5JC_01025 [Bacteroidota bacterium]|jgi:hypothetical protein